MTLSLCLSRQQQSLATEKEISVFASLCDPLCEFIELCVNIFFFLYFFVGTRPLRRRATCVVSCFTRERNLYYDRPIFPKVYSSYAPNTVASFTAWVLLPVDVCALGFFFDSAVICLSRLFGRIKKKIKILSEREFTSGIFNVLAPRLSLFFTTRQYKIVRDPTVFEE